MCVERFGLALDNLGQFAEAETHYERAIQLQPQYGDAHWNRVAVAVENKSLAETDRGNPGEVAVPARGPQEIALSRCGGVFRVNAIEPDPDRACVVDPDVGRHPVVLDLAVAVERNNVVAAETLEFLYTLDGELQRLKWLTSHTR